MKITNRKNLPKIIVDAVKNDPYDAGEKTDYSATTLIKPAYQVKLERQYRDQITEDAADRLWSMYGTAVHYIIERAADEKDLIEKRFYAVISGKTISAQIDHYRDGDISDWKLTSAYKIKKAIGFEQEIEDWEQQLNIQAFLMKWNGFKIKRLFIGAMCRDWSPFKHKTESGYPDQIEYIHIPLWTYNQQQEFIESRIEAMLAAEPCSQKERWQDDASFALMKNGGARAVKLGIDESTLRHYAGSKGILLDGPEAEHKIVERTQPNRRCEGYCSVNKFCDFYKANYMAEEDLPLKKVTT